MSGRVELPMAPAGRGSVSEAPESQREGDRRFRVEGMHCAACAQTVQKSVTGLDGVVSAYVSFGTATLTLDGDVDDQAVIAAVTRCSGPPTPA